VIVKDVLKRIGIDSNDTRIVKGVTFDSRKVKEGYIFVAYKGEKVDGNDYIYKAFENGAICVVSDRLVGYDVYKSDDIEKAKVSLCQLIYSLNKIKLIGITGTNGKTSSAHLVYQSLNNLGIRATYIGTLGVIDGDYIKELDNTTPNMDTLSFEINEAIKRKCEYVVMEVSSHALSMNRVKPFSFDVVAFTNLTQDHLDYYKDLEEYFNAKKLLFDTAKENCIGIINNEDNYSNKIIKDFKGKVIRYGNSSEYDYEIIKNDLNGLVFKVNEAIINSKLIYKTNIYNLLLTYVILSTLGYDKDLIIKAISDCNVIEGRMEVIANNNNYIILDYAHTPDAMERILKETNKIKKGRNIVLFGCGGNRDKSKREIMGKIANDYADFIYLTNDNPRFEKDDDIINDILFGIENKNKLIIEKDREKAITMAIKQMKENDVLLILGKGHEDYQIIKDQKYHLSDREIVLVCIKK